MTITEKYDTRFIGAASGIFLPLVVGILIYLFSSKGLSVPSYLSNLAETNIITHSISICVFPNVIVFMLFNRYDMLRACRGVLAVTIMWAVIVFAVKFFG